MDRGDAAQHRQGEVERLVRAGRTLGHQRAGPVGHVGDDAGPAGLVEAPGLHRDVAGRVVQAEEGLEVLTPVLGDHLTVPLRVEAVDHHPVVPGEDADLGRQRLGQVQHRRGRGQVGDCRLGGAVGQRGRGGVAQVGLDLDHEQATAAVHHRLDRLAHPGRAADAAGEAERDAGPLHVQLGDRHVPLDRVGRALAQHRGQRRAQHGGDRPAEQLLGVARDHRHPPVGLVDAQEHPVRLDRPRDVDRLGVAVGQVDPGVTGLHHGAAFPAGRRTAPAAGPERRASG